MLTVFIILIITLSCVGGVTVVTQNPPLISVNKGETVSLVCNTGSSTDGGRWYKQVAGGTPQFVLNSFHGWSSPKYGSGFSSPKFTVSYPTKSDCHLSISNVDVGDSAVYYCGTWDSSAKENVFGQGTKLIVTDADVDPPVLNILRPSREDLTGSSKVTLVCLINHMSVAFADVHWLLNGKSVTTGVFTSSAEQQPDQKFKMSSYLTLESSEWDKDPELTCEASVASKTTRTNIKKSECSD
ncbi:M1-specific T cell receptor beta chain-like isoform X4 [Pimephales promelas]|uniref:M1-specific T cell receptor beta chain-like isoform X4 n=1 Tax=Pimephales promelas TaxID=90988 RepID=UPI001955C1E8|nr:M1-specific T cell receptor beta chain-like isoform X4 [Pimephales promelas]